MCLSVFVQHFSNTQHRRLSVTILSGHGRQRLPLCHNIGVNRDHFVRTWATHAPTHPQHVQQRTHTHTYIQQTYDNKNDNNNTRSKQVWPSSVCSVCCGPSQSRSLCPNLEGAAQRRRERRLPLILTSHAILSTTRPPISCLLAHASVAREAAQCSDAARRSDQVSLVLLELTIVAPRSNRCEAPVLPNTLHVLRF